MEIVQAFKEGGSAMFGVLALDMFAMVAVATSLALAIVARARPEMRTVSLAVALIGIFTALLPMCTGAAGYWSGMSQVEAVLPMVDPDQRDELARVGQEEASHNLTFGFGSGCTCLLPAVIALLLVPPKRG